MNHIENDELQQMREQLHLLKDKLSQEHIITEKVIRRAVRDKISLIRRRSMGMITLGCLAVVLCPATLFVSGFSFVYTALTTLFLLISVIAEIYSINMIKSPAIMSNNLLSVGVNATRAKRFQQRWLIIGLLFLAIWLPWGAYELSFIYPNPREFHIMLISGAVGGVIGGIVGGSVYYRNQRELTEIVDHIEDITSEEI